MADKARTPFRVVAGWTLFGIAIGAAAVLVSLKAMGVSMQPGLNTPAFTKFLAAYDDLHNKYFRTESDQTLLNGAVAGMTQSLKDPFTDYFPPADAKQFQNMLSGSYVGIGVGIEQRDGQTVITSVTNGAPAEKAGLKPQDIIVAVNGKSVAGMTLDSISTLVMGPKGTTVKLSIKRPSVANHLMEFDVTRDQITKHTVFSKMLGHGVGYLQITVVADNTAAEVKSALEQLRKGGATRLIIDVRGNPGGYLDQAVDIAGDFIPSGKVVVQTADRYHPVEKLTSRGPGLHMPIVVLMDQDTASAAEILAGALHDDLGVPLVGTKSFGKGTVQETDSFPDGSTLKYTVAKWLTPNGQWIHGKGLQPTVLAKLPGYLALAPVTQAKLPLVAGENNSDVANLQKLLTALHFPVNRTDGYYDQSTAAAVSAFQKSVGLPPTGTVNTATAAKLEAAFEQLATQSDTQLAQAEKVVLQTAP